MTPNTPLFKTVRIAYMFILVGHALGTLLYLAGLIYLSVVHRDIKKSSYYYGWENLRWTVAWITVFTILFVIGIIKQILSWIGVNQFTRCSMISVLVLNSLSLAITFVTLVLAAAFTVRSFILLATILSLPGFVIYIADTVVMISLMVAVNNNRQQQTPQVLASYRISYPHSKS
jgi:hypothetical protein